jgi:excisionase family DNA binding protein
MRTKIRLETLPPWNTASDDALYPITGLGPTPLGLLPKRTAYHLIQSGRLPAVRIGSRLYLRKLTIQRFIEQSERAERQVEA